MPKTPATGTPPWRIAHTYSICAVDRRTGEAGVAVASRALAVGSFVPYARPGAGAMAIQGCVVPEYGNCGLAWLSKGAAAGEVLRRLCAQDLPATALDDDVANSYYRNEGMTVAGEDFLLDPARGRTLWRGERIRQVGIVDRQGNAAVHDGARLLSVVASRVGDGFTCQGSALTGAPVVDAMAGAYEKAVHLGQAMDAALMQALLAAQEQGGDKRGTRAAALLVVRERGHWSGSDRYRDLRVDDDPNPVQRLAEIWRQF